MKSKETLESLTNGVTWPNLAVPQHQKTCKKFVNQSPAKHFTSIWSRLTKRPRPSGALSKLFINGFRFIITIFSVTMCPNTKNFWVGDTTPQDCAACVNFMTDLQLIAINDPNHFAQFYKVVTTDICKELGGFETKICLSEVGNYEQDVAQALATGDPNQICQAALFCDQQ